MLETKKVLIKEKPIEIEQFNCREGLKLSVLTMQYFSETYFKVLSNVLKASKGMSDTDVVNLEGDLNLAIIDALKTLPQNIDADAFEEYCSKMLAKTIVVNEYVTHENFDTIFGADWTLLYNTLFEVIKFNFGGFFLDVVGIITAEIQ